MEQNLSLRSRPSTSGTPKTERSDSVPLPRYEGSPPSAHVLPSSKRAWLRQLLLVGCAFYVLLMLAWYSQNLNAVHTAADLAASKSNVAAWEMTSKQEGGMDSTAALRAQKKTKKTEEETKEHAVISIFTQAVIDVSMEASQVREALRQARDAVVVKMKTEGFKSSAPASSGSQVLDEERKQQEAEEQARDALLLPKNEAKPRNLKCLGWRATDGCSPYGPRKSEKDLICTSSIPHGHSGYCEVEDVETGERFRVMRRYCSSSKSDSYFRCFDAPAFANFHYKAREAANNALAPGFTLPNILENFAETLEQTQRDGIVMVVYPKLIPSAYATIKLLREVLGCRLPIEIWYCNAEFRTVPNAMKPLSALAAKNETSIISFREITERHAFGYNAKVFAIYNSYFERILFLDADNAPARDPTFLFSSTEFLENGAVFWPDFWHPGRTIFNIHSQSLLWEFMDMPYINMFEQESGQILIDRRRHAEALELVKFYTFHQPSYFDNMKLVHGDKDLFRLAWLKLDAPFYMIKVPPALAGKIVNESFCGMTMVQHDAQGDVLFLHRNSHKLMGEPLREQNGYWSQAVMRSRKKAEIRQKLRQERKAIPNSLELDAIVQMEMSPAPTLEAPEPDGYPDSVVWTHLLSFSNASKLENYYVETYKADPEFPQSQNCYGQRNVSKTNHFFAQEMVGLPFAGLELDLRRFAAEAVELRRA